MPLLAETGTQDDYDRVLVVDCEPQLQLRRLMARDGTGRSRCPAHDRRPGDRAARLAIADDVIRNDGDIAALAAQVQDLHARYLSLARHWLMPYARAPSYAK